MWSVPSEPRTECPQPEVGYHAAAPGSSLLELRAHAAAGCCQPVRAGHDHCSNALCGSPELRAAGRGTHPACRPSHNPSDARRTGPLRSKPLLPADAQIHLASGQPPLASTHHSRRHQPTRPTPPTHLLVRERLLQLPQILLAQLHLGSPQILLQVPDPPRACTRRTGAPARTSAAGPSPPRSGRKPAGIGPNCRHAGAASTVHGLPIHMGLAAVCGTRQGVLPGIRSPGMGTTSGPWASTHASASCEALHPLRRATPCSRSTSSRFWWGWGWGAVGWGGARW